MGIDADIQRDLNRIHRVRNRVGYLPSLIAFFFSVYFQREQLLLDARWYIAGVLVFTGTLLRVFTGETLYVAWERGHVGVRFFHRLSFFCIALGWGLHFSDIFYHYGPASNNVTYTLLVIVAFVTGASTSLLAQKDCYYIFVSTLTISVFITFFSDQSWKNSYIVLNLFLYVLFSVTNFRFSSAQLHDLLSLKKSTRTEKERFRNLIDTVPGFVGLLDKDSVCYMANQATLAVFPDIVGKKLGNLDPLSSWEKHVLDFMDSSRSTEIFEEKTTFHGEDVYAILNIQKTKDGGAIIVSIITTELVEVRKNLRIQEAKAQYSAKLASLGEMAAGVAHEVNNPLTIIQGAANIMSRLLDEEPLDKNNMRLMTRKVMETTDRISRTVKSLKSLSRNGENDPKVEIKVEQILNISLELAHQKSKMFGVEVRSEVSLPKYVVMGREVELSQVLVNLLSNSIDAVRGLTGKKWIEVKVRNEGEFLDIYVVDSGKGIPKEIQARIMDPFFTTKDVNQGTGLGLSISKSIMTNHGGELSLLEHEENTTFRMRMPLKKNLS